MLGNVGMEMQLTLRILSPTLLPLTPFRGSQVNTGMIVLAPPTTFWIR